jgi:glyoxylase-like metal-dependent hydrolase (beta-lactamase superfamily II)
VPHVDNSVTADVRHEIVFVDTSVANYQSLLRDLNPNAEVVLIDPQQDGLKVIGDSLAGRSDIDAIHILSHGDTGQVQLGNGWIDSADVASHADLLAAIGNSLSERGDCTDALVAA